MCEKELLHAEKNKKYTHTKIGEGKSRNTNFISKSLLFILGTIQTAAAAKKKNKKKKL